MKRAWVICALLMILGCGDDDGVPAGDAPLVTGDAAIDATIAPTCQGEPPTFDAGIASGPIAKCTEPPRCAPAVCWQCLPGTTGPEWMLLGDDRCRRDAGPQDAMPRD